MPKKDPTYDRIERALFKDREEASSILSQREMEIKKRMMLCVSKKMEDPLIQDTELVNFLMNGCGGNADAVSQSQAYRDIGMINRLVGNIQLICWQHSTGRKSLVSVHDCRRREKSLQYGNRQRRCQGSSCSVGQDR